MELSVVQKEIETWTYERGAGKYIQFLEFDGAVLLRIVRGPRG